MITSTFILKKTAASYDNWRTAIGLLIVFVFADGGAGVGIHTTVTTVHILGRVCGTGNRHPIPMDRVPTVSYQ